MKVERVSYEVMTPSAARGILEAIYWKPEMRWVVDRVHVCAPIRFTHIRRNEIDQPIPAGKVRGVMRGDREQLFLAIEKHRQQRAAVILCNVRYGIAAHVEVTDPRQRGGEPLEHPEAKHLEAFKRRAKRGQYFHHPYLGCREFPAHFRLLDDGENFSSCPADLLGERDLGFMLWDITFAEDTEGNVVESHTGRRLRATPRFFRAYLVDGVVTVPPAAETWG